ncbi:TonB-dependent receptor domain-containing protein, partial [Xanthomonas vasicola]|uniref:TonB-dependent receptor domain-containing protein n=1 Tax=Xanthomonas vasicola TaxID=56459 RepID=UPI000F44DD42
DGDANHGNWLPRRARQSGRIDADRSIGAFGVGASLFGSGALYDDLANTERLAGYGLLDLRVSYAVNADWKVQLAANN